MQDFLRELVCPDKWTARNQVVIICVGKLGSKTGASNHDVKEAQPDPARPALTSRQRRSAQRKRDFLQAKREPTAAAAVAAAAAAAAPAAPAAPAAVATTERGTLADAKLIASTVHSTEGETHVPKAARPTLCAARR